MNITISGKDFPLTPTLKEYVTIKLEKLIKFHRGIKRIGVEMDIDRNARQGRINRIEVWAYLPNKTISAGIKAEHMREAIDLVCPILERRLTRDKEKSVAKRRRAAAKS